VTAPLDVDPAALQADPEAVAKAGAAGPVEGRSLGQIAWTRFKRDKVAVAGGLFVVFLVVVAVSARFLPIPDPYEFHTDLLDTNLGGLPKGKLGGISADHWLGVEPSNGRDIFSRILYGAGISLFIAIPATLLSVAIGAIMGVTAGYVGGFADTFINWVMNVLLAFPVLVFSIALIAVSRAIVWTRV
jgi:ABC-type dipeptide/oligopeptide/nickel transport system permease subunit